MQETLRNLLAGRTLSQDAAYETFESILSGGADEAQIAGLLTLLQQRGPTVE
ncbi:MAG: anthranilate phosphoribosyltransferase, partial [Phycisphaerales bacterium JB038]